MYIWLTHLRLLLTFTVLAHITNVVHNEELGGEVTGYKLLTKLGSPHSVSTNLVIQPEATLKIEPGTEIRFKPGIGIMVHGQLTALGTKNEKIKFTKADGGSFNDEPPPWPADIRLANGSDIHEGVVQILYRNQWRSMCANYANWTAADAEVVCRQLGFASPVKDHFSYNFTATDYHSFVAVRQPGCTGSEERLLSCKGAQSPMYSSQICRDQRSLYLKCRGLRADLVQGHWDGLKFYNTTFERKPINGEGLNESTSVLQHVDVLYAGVTQEKLPTAAISASPYVPKLFNVRVMFSAYDAINFTDINTTTILRDCEVAHNRGHGINVTTSFGRVRITGSSFQHNGGNGVYIRTVDKIFRRWEWRDGDFCVHASGDVFPQIFTGTVPSGSKVCPKRFVANEGDFLTISILEMVKDPTVKDAKLELFNGDCLTTGASCPSKRAPVLRTWKIENLGTIGLPQSEVTSQHIVTIKFTLDSIYNHDCYIVPGCVKFVLLITKAKGAPGDDVILSRVTASNNNLHGALIENPRSFVKVTDSTFSKNQYGAGFRIRGGACDVDMRNSVLDENANSGLNITYSGGARIFKNVKTRRNKGVGMYIDYIHQHKTRVERHQKSELITVTIEDNAGVGLRVGNYCRDSLVVVNGSAPTVSKISNNGAEGIHILSCYGSATGLTNFTVADAELTSNGYQAVRVSPMLSMTGMIRNSTFTRHDKGVILVDNTDNLQRNRAFLDKRVIYDIESNAFTDNYGPYVVNLRLTKTKAQIMVFRYNALTGNHIRLGATKLKPRSRARAVAVISSNNIHVNRNKLINPDSTLEIATHSIDTAIFIDAKRNWWGNPAGGGIITDANQYHRRILVKILDQENRYNLASVAYFPALKSHDLDSAQVSTDGVPYPEVFYRQINGVKYLGGRMKTDFQTEAGAEYVLDSDVNIPPSKQFKLLPGTVLHFDNTVGVLVKGKIHAVGSSAQPIILKRRIEDNSYTNVTWMRLSGGDNELEGVLELNLTGEWSTVCNKGWTVREASIVCQHFGYTLQPDMWIIRRPRDYDSSQPILFNYVRCTDSDSDIRDCIHDVEADFNDCTHDDDVSMRCVPPTWAGVKIVATARQSELRHVTIEEAGLLDYFTNEFVPALLVDKNYHLFSDLLITRSSSTGMSIIYSEPFGQTTPDISTINVISRSTFSHNLGDGLKTRSSYLTLQDCTFTGNRLSGFSYDPKLPLLTAFNVRKAISGDSITDINESLNGKVMQIPSEGTVKYYQAKNNGVREIYTAMFEIKAARADQRVTLQVLDYSPETYIERLVIYDSKRANIGSAQSTAIEEDNVDLPLISASDTLTLKYSVNGTKSGRLMFTVSSRSQNSVEDRAGTVPHNIRATLRLKDCEFTNNRRGLLLTHYNNPSNEHMDLFIRIKYEQVILDNVTVTGNSEEAMLVPSVTKYNEIYMPDVQLLEKSHRMANITYKIRNSRFLRNGRGIAAEHNHVDFSNNMWRWMYTDNVLAGNKAGGLQIELPVILDPYSNGNHSIDVNNSRFTNNAEFEFSVSGGYANLSVYKNVFEGNTADRGVISLSGMEKKMFVSENEIVKNTGKFMMEMNMNSHSEFGVSQSARVFKNLFKDNEGRSAVTPTVKGEETLVSSYTMALRGIQKVNITRNLFQDKLPYTFIADVPSTSLTTVVNVRENYWSTTNQSVIRRKIFDFNDWSSYAIANYSSFLTSADFNSPVTSQKFETVVFDVRRPLGGVITANLTIPYRKEAYEVVSDVTIQQGITVTVEPGTTFKIKPNIGFLVLGRLLANGLSRRPISFLPSEKSTHSTKTVRYRREDAYISPPNITSADGLCRRTSVEGLRLCGGENAKEGFIQLFNTTINAWSVVCDPQFNDRTAEVFCRSMGHYSGNVAVRYSELFDYFTFGRDLDLYKDKWTRTFLCKGDENHLNDCRLRINYNLNTCSALRGYVFIRCGERNLDQKYDYWGNIRFATNSLEAGANNIPRSALRNVRIVGAGVLHGNKVPAIMATYQTTSTYNIDIRDCAAGGLDFISPRSNVFLLNSRIENNLGTGLNILVLNGERGEQPSKFKALNSSSVPYRVYGMINMCDSEKVVEVDRRVLVYYKYDFDTVNCVKVFRNKHKTQLNIRFLQMNLFHDDFSRNFIEIFDGPDFVNHLLLKRVRYDTTEQEKRSIYKTTRFFNVEFKQYQPQYQMGLHIHASPASGRHGFIAEITTSSSSYTGAAGVHKVIGNSFYKNTGGSLRYSTVGEKNPGIVAVGNVFRENGLDVLNLTSAENILLEAQNVDDLSVGNNMLVDNNGSCTIWLSANGASKVVAGNISNNIFYGTINGEALRIYGSSYLEVMVLFNYIVENIAENLNTVDLRYVTVNVTGNTVFKNKGAHAFDLWSSNDVTQSSQVVQYNQFYANYPGDKFKDSQHGGNNTALYSAGFYRNKMIRYNWFENKFHFELSTHNRTSTNEKPARDKSMQVNAQYNYWGHKVGVDNTDLVVRARMHDYRDDTNLSMINYAHFYADNISLPQVEGSFETGYCLVGWKLTESKKCYKYYGGVATYTHAVALCALEKSTIVRPSNQFWVEIGKVVQYSQQDYGDQVRAWVDEPESARPEEKCSVVIDSRYDEADCSDRLPFVCESDQIGALPATWRELLVLWILLGIGGFLLLVGGVFVLIWFLKSRKRKEQRFERRASLRASIRSNKYAINNGALTQGSQTNIASSLYGSRNALANRPMARGRATSREATHSIALTDFTMGETDVDVDDTEPSRKNGYTSTGSHDDSDSDKVGEETPLTTSLKSLHVGLYPRSKGYAGSVDSSGRGSRDNISEISRPMKAYDPAVHTEDPNPQPEPRYQPRALPVAAQRPAPAVESRFTYDRYHPATSPRLDYSNDGYSTDSPKHEPEPAVVPSAEQYQPVALQPAPRPVAVASGEDNPSDHAYMNTSRLYRQPEPLPSPVDQEEVKRKELYNQRRPTRPAPAAAHLQPPRYTLNQQPPGYGTATRDDLGAAAGARPTPPTVEYRGYRNSSYGLAKRDSFSTMDTKSLDSYDSEFSIAKPPLSYVQYDHSRQSSEEKKPFETDIDSMYSEDQADMAPLYPHRQSPTAQARPRTRAYNPSPLVRDIPTGYDSDASSQYRHQNQFNSQQELAGSDLNPSYYGRQYGRQPAAETDIDAMSEMTDDWTRQGPPVETDF